MIQLKASKYSSEVNFIVLSIDDISPESKNIKNMSL